MDGEFGNSSIDPQLIWSMAGAFSIDSDTTQGESLVARQTRVEGDSGKVWIYSTGTSSDKPL